MHLGYDDVPWPTDAPWWHTPLAAFLFFVVFPAAVFWALVNFYPMPSVRPQRPGNCLWTNVDLLTPDQQAHAIPMTIISSEMD